MVAMQPHTIDLHRSLRSPNFKAEPIAVEFVVLHYTACDLQRTLDIFLDPSKEVSAHLVVGNDGAIHELVPCWDGEALRAFHAGRSRWEEAGRLWEQFNGCSIGIELVNENGNVFPYTDLQYLALQRIVEHLRGVYPALRSPRRFLGHEHIAGWRGKVDPGWEFDWRRLFALFPDQQEPLLSPVLPPQLRDAVKRLAPSAPQDVEKRNHFWENVNLLLGESVSLLSETR